MNILVIGNGFDLEHKLPTRYWDFLCFLYGVKNYNSNTWVKPEYNENPKEFIKDIPCFKNYSDNVKNILLNDTVFEVNERDDNLKFINEQCDTNIWIKYFIKRSTEKVYKDKGWIDFESEISDIIKSLDYCMKYNKNTIKRKNSNDDMDAELWNIAYNFFKDCGIITNESYVTKFQLSDFYDEKAKNIIKNMNNDLNNLILCLQIYLCDYVENIEIEKKSKYIENIKFDKVLSFNYTHTFKKVYANNNDEVEINYVHGETNGENCKEKKNNMVLGIDEYLKGDEKNTEVEFISFKKYFQRIFKRTGCEYKNWIVIINNSSNEENNNIYFFGHSLDVTDKDIIKELISLPRTKINIFYYDDDAYASQIANLVKVIKQDKLISMVYGINPKIVFQKQDK